MFTRASRKRAAFTSHVLPQVCAELATREKPNVLDIGGGVASTLDFLSAYGARVFFLDLAEADHADYRASLQAYAGTLFDVCFFWDYLHRLTPGQLSELSDALVPYIYSDTLGYSIFSVPGFNDAGPHTFRLCSAEQLALEPAAVKGYQPWSYREFNTCFDAFSIEQDVLSEDGYLELLFAVE